MAGAAQGGAELFFERLATSFATAGVTQTVMIKPDPGRMNRLAAAGVPAQGCAFSSLMAVLHKRQLATAIRKSRATVILSWMNRATGMTPRTGIPHVARLGGFYNLKYYRHCDWLVANTRGIADYLVREGVPADRVHHQINFVPDGIDGAIFDGSRHDGSRHDGPRHDGPVIAALGRLHPNKAFDTLIRAFARLDDGTLWLAGDGPDRQALAALAAELGVAERVRFLGWQEDPQAVIRGADLFVCPSRHEPFGNVIAEAMACGKPVISTSSHGGTELIEDGVNGVLVPVDDAGAMADAMRQITGDKALAGRLAAAGRSHWQKTLSPAQVTADWIAFLAKVAG
jgi:glycosyltransferase involved in cell wall biosynthesis